MTTRLRLVLMSTLLLSGCTSLEGVLSFEETPPSAPAIVAQAPAAPAPAALDDARCQRVAASDRLRAQASGYDAATLDRMTLASYQQCRFLTAP